MAQLKAILPDALDWCPSRYGPMLFPARDAYVGRSLALYHEYSEGEVALFRQIVGPGDVVVEAGANLGALTLPLARLVGKGGQVWAFEPQRGMQGLLCANMVLNGQYHVRCERMALGAGAGEIAVPDLDMGTAFNFGGLSLGESGGACPVATLDSFALPALRLLKIDVEGAETEVLSGATDTIARLRPHLYVENDRPTQSETLIRLIQSMGYRLWWHFVPLYNPGNFRGNAENVFGVVGSLNMICLPAEWDVNISDGIEITDPTTPHPFA